MLNRCIECGKEISSIVDVCPSCGSLEPFKDYESCTYCNHQFLPIEKEALLKPKELKTRAMYAKRTPTNEHCPYCKCPDPFNPENAKYISALKNLTEEYDSKFPKLAHSFGQCECGYGNFFHHPIRASYRGYLNSVNIVIVAILTLFFIFFGGFEKPEQEAVEYLIYFSKSLFSAIGIWFLYLVFHRKLIKGDAISGEHYLTYRNELFDFFGKDKEAIYGSYVLGDNYKKLPNILYNEKIITKCPNCDKEKEYEKKVFSNKGMFREVK